MGEGVRVTYNGFKGVRLAAERWEPQGDARSVKGDVVLQHGGGQTRHSWSKTAERLCDAGWRVLSMDLRGHGESDWAPDADYRMNAYVGDLESVVATLSTPPVLVGASLGGIAALVAAGENPKLARAVVLVDIVPRTEPGGTDRIRQFMNARPEGYDTLEEVAEAVAAYNPHRARKVNVDGLRKNLRRGDDGRWHWHWDPAFMNPPRPEHALDISGNRLHEAAAQVRVPTLVVRGEQSDVITQAGIDELLAMIPGSTAVTVPGAGHMVAGDDNDVFSREVISFLDTLPS
ncbi:MAG TPA: alpha/beta hydrolase [Mycobacteriales bacterium]|nr:alpha/beta hydrolase [Mycobacteriales bacterium]